MQSYKQLVQLEDEGNQIQVGLIGSGQMGTDIVNQIQEMEGIKVPIVADLDLARARQAYQTAGIRKTEIYKTNNRAQMENYVETGKKVITEAAFTVPKVGNIDVIIDATGVPEVGAKMGLESINQGKHIVMMNVEADICVGPILNQLADNAGVVYTGAAGDEPGAIMEIYNFAKSLGYNIVAAGKGKNNPLDQTATPDDLRKKAEEKGTSVHMLTSFVEGTKTMVEMAAVSNATGLKVDVSGMHGPDTTIDELPQTFSLQEQGGILNQEGIVDYALGNVAPGVFVIVSSANQRVNFSMNYSKMGPGPNYLLYRPYHLASLETPLSAAKAVIDGEATIAPEYGIVTEVTTVAKQDLQPGDKLDGMGGFTVYGSVDKAGEADEQNLLPLSLADEAEVTAEIKQGEKITYDMVKLNQDSVLYELRSLQDRMFIK